MKLSFSVIIPVFNRPDEVDELLHSFTQQDFNDSYEIIIVEDGSSLKCNLVVEKYSRDLNINYYFKENSGAGLSRNFGMLRANGNYFIVLDSDVILPSHYLKTVKEVLASNYTDGFGGPDAAHPNFTIIQKAINYSMTSFLTTGGIRGKKRGIGKYQLRSYNLGLSKKAFEVTKGFSAMTTGEDIDLTFRLWDNHFETQLISNAFVYHKRRTSIKQFFNQTYRFGQARPKLNRIYPGSGKITFWFPSLFMIGLDISILLIFFGEVRPISFYYLYFLAIFCHASYNNGIFVGVTAMLTSFIQFLGYGLGFLKSMLKL